MTDNHGKITIKGIIIILSIFILSFVFIGTGMYFNYLNNPKNIFKSAITNTSKNIVEIVEVDNNKSLLNINNLSVNSNIKFNYALGKSASENINEYKKLLENLSKLDTNIEYKQDLTNKKLFTKIDSKMNNEDYINLKYLIKDSTGYYYNPEIKNNYINTGNNNLFEVLQEEANNKENLIYIENIINKVILEEIDKEKIDSKKEKINIDNKYYNSIKLSISYNNNRLNELYNNIINSLKEDEKANKIITAYYKDFSKIKTDKTIKFIGTNDKINISIYVNPVTAKFLKSEINYKENDNEYKIIYEKINDRRSNLYLIENENKKELQIRKESDTKYSAQVLDSSKKNIGTIIINKTEKEMIMSISVLTKDYRFDVDYKSSYKDIKKDSFNNIVDFELKYLENNINVITITTNIKSKVKKYVDIDEDTSNSIIKSSLIEQENNKLEEDYENIKKKLLGE